MTIGENMYLGNERGKSFSINWNETYGEADKYLKIVGLEESSRTLIKDIGVGKQQLVEIAKALAKHAKLLILDEPTASLNEDDSKALLELLLKFKKQGMTSIIISHKLNEISYVADKITVIRDGSSIETLDKKKDDFSEQRIIQGMVGREMTDRFPKRPNVKIGDVSMEVKNWNVYHPLYTERKVVNDVSFKIHKGEVVGISGLMGAGRTELAMSIFGKSYGTKISGQIFMNGKEVKLNTVKEAIDNKLAYVTEDRKGNGLILSKSIKMNTSLANMAGVSNGKVIDTDKEYAVAEEYRKKLKTKCPTVEQNVGNLTGGNIDLSVGSVVCFVAAVGGKMMVLNSMNPYLSMIVMLLIGIAIGAWQGFWIAYVRIPPFIVTLAGMFAFRGLSNVVLEGQTLAPMPDAYLGLFNNYIPDFLGGGEGFNRTCFVVGIIVCIVYVALVMKNRADRAKKGYSVDAFGGVAIKMVLICVVVLAFMYRLAQYKGIPNSLVWVAVIIAIYTYVASKTTTGRYFYAVGGKEKATKLSGIDTNKVYFLAYLNMGLLAAIAGMVTMARLNSANPQAGTNFEMDAIGSCFIGGASAYGGTGTVPGVIIGALLMGVLNLGMSIMGIDQNIQKVVKGLVLLAAVIFDVVSKRKSFIVK